MSSHFKILNVYYKMVNNETAQYLTRILPQKKQNLTDHNLRNKHDRIIPKSRTTLYMNSFIPLATRKWNELTEEIKQCGSFSEFKSKTKPNIPRLSKFCLKGTRKIQIILAQFRMKCSPLNSHLADMHIIENRNCDCGTVSETLEHYLINCPKYDHIRYLIQPYLTMLNNNVDMLINGINDLDEVRNQKLIEDLSKYIELSNRFWN